MSMSMSVEAEALEGSGWDSDAPPKPKEGKKGSKPKKKQQKKKADGKGDKKDQKAEEKKTKKKKKKAPVTIEDYLKRTKKSWTTLTTFHQLYVRKDKRQILMGVRWGNKDCLFFPQLTLRGFEGSLPDMWDITPKNTGLRFEQAPDGTSLLLVEEQQSQPYDDLASSIYSAGTRGANRGFLRSFKPVFVSRKQRASLIDVTSWIFSFSIYALKAARMAGRSRGMGPSETHIQEIRAFPDNFFAAFATQRRSPEPLKGRGSRTVYFTAGFCRLPAFPMTPRTADRRVGFFTTTITAGGTKAVGMRQRVINRWDLRRRNNEIVYLIDRKVPKAFWPTIKRAVTSWNAAFAAAGFRNDPVKCYAPSDREFPEDFAPGDARWSCIFMTDPYIPVYGYGPSLTDFRSGEILVGHVLLGFQSFVVGTSRDSFEALERDFHKPYLDADHPDVLKNLEFTVMHEVGHTLGLRHNFISSEDGRTSVMDYPDDMDTTVDPENGEFGGHYLEAPGRYDVYAIKYGYTPLAEEKRGARHPKLELLANGQEHFERLSAQPLNPLFGTDENIFSFDPRVNRWVNQVDLMGRDKLKYVMAVRGKIRELTAKKPAGFRPEELTSRVVRCVQALFRSVSVGCRFIGGSFLDETRTKLVPCSPVLARTAVRSVVDLCVGEALRFSKDELQFFTASWSTYDLRQVDTLQMHSESVESIILLLLSQLQMVENQRGKAGSTNGVSTFSILESLCFQCGNESSAIFHPISFVHTPEAKDMSSISDDIHRMVVQQIIVRQMRNMATSRMPSAVSIGATAMLSQIRDRVKRAVSKCAAGLHPVALAHWDAIVKGCEVKVREPVVLAEDDHHHHRSVRLPTVGSRQHEEKFWPGWLRGPEQWSCFYEPRTRRQGRSCSCTRCGGTGNLNAIESTREEEPLRSNL